MTQTVADETLGRIARQQNDLFRRVREGTLNPGQVSKGLQDLIQGMFYGAAVAPTVSAAFRITANYDLSIEDAVKLGQYDWAHENITSGNFPTERKGAAEISFKLVYFGRVISTERVLAEFNEMRLRSAESHELLAFGEKCPHIQRRFPIVALDSPWRYRAGVHAVPYLQGDDFGRRVFLEQVEGDWPEFWRFAAVSK